MKNSTHKVAIVRFIGGYTGYDDYNDTIVSSITNWEEVDESQYQLLVSAAQYAASHRLAASYQVMELLDTNSEPVIASVQKYTEYIAKQQEQVQREKDEKKRKAEQRQLAKLAKDKKAREDLYKKLKDEFGQ